MDRFAIATAAAALVAGASGGVAVAHAADHDAGHDSGSATADHDVTARVKSTAFGPTGYDGLRLGMRAAEIRKAGGTVRRDPRSAPCEAARLPGSTSNKAAVDGWVSKSVGLAYITTTDPSARTPEGIHVGSTRAEAEAAYPHAVKAVDFWSAPVPGHPGTSYWWGYQHGKVAALTLVVDKDHCVN